ESTSSQQPKPRPKPVKTQEKKHKLVTNTSDEPSPAKSSKLVKVTKRRKPTNYLSLVDKFVNEGNLERKPRRTPAPTEPSGHAESPLIYVELGLIDSNTESDEEVPPVVKIKAQDEGQARPNPVVQDEGQAEPNTDFSFGDQFFNDKPSEAENEKTTAETKVESMVSITIHQDTSVIPPMTSSVIDLISRPDSPNDHQPLPATATTTGTTTMIITTLPLPPQPQQGTTDSILIKHVGKLEKIMANLIQDNKHLEERLDSHGSCLYKLENLNIPQHVSKAMDEIVTDVVDWAIQAPLRNRFRDFPKADMKEILHQRMWKTNSYKAHEDYMMLYEALEKPMNHDHTDELLTDLAEARRKKKMRHDLPKIPPGSPPHQTPPPPPPADLEYLRYDSKGGRHALSISKMKAAYYPDVGLEQMVPNQMWIEEECKAVQTYMRILSVVRIEVFSMYGYDYMKKIVLHRADLNEHIIAERDFNIRTQVTLKILKDSPRAVTFRDKYGVQMIMQFNEIHKFSDGTLHHIDEALDYRVKEFKVDRMNPGLNTSDPMGCVISPSQRVNVIEILRDDLNLPSPERIAYFHGMCNGSFKEIL
nr:hypothetical protein [Tanacetum cinerariifolium]